METREATMIRATMPVVCYLSARYEKPVGWDELSDSEKAIDALSRIMEDHHDASCNGEGIYYEPDFARAMVEDTQYEQETVMTRVMRLPESGVHPGLSDMLKRYQPMPELLGDLALTLQQRAVRFERDEDDGL